MRRLFSLILFAYPRAFRRRFGDEMYDDFRRRPLGTAGTLRTLGTLAINGLAERWSAVVRWAWFSNATPHLYEPAGRHHMFLDTLRADVRHTIRLAVKTPVFTTLTILTLALGIGATSAIFAVINGVLLRALPYRDDAQLVNVWSNNTSESRPRNPLSPANFLDFQRMNTTLDGLEGYFAIVTPTQLKADSGTEVVFGLFVTSNLFNMPVGWRISWVSASGWIRENSMEHAGFRVESRDICRTGGRSGSTSSRFGSSSDRSGRFRNGCR